jgi:acetyl-CoA carboxylase biotin carboxyl carrier protein
MDYKDIINLIKLIGKSNLSEFKMKEGDFEIVIKTDKYQKGSKEIRHITGPEFTAQAPTFQQRDTDGNQGTDSQVQGESLSDTPEASTPKNNDLLEVRSPIVGTFYRAPSPGKEPYIKVGDTIESGDVVCIVEAMKLFNEIESEISGKVVKVVAEDASPVEYDQVLFLIDPKG